MKTFLSEAGVDNSRHSGQRLMFNRVVHVRLSKKRAEQIPKCTLHQFHGRVSDLAIDVQISMEDLLPDPDFGRKIPVTSNDSKLLRDN